MDKNIRFFNDNVEVYSTRKPDSFDICCIEFMKKRGAWHNSTLLDIGGGSGVFSVLVKNNFPSIEVTLVDPCSGLLEKLNDPRIIKMIGNLPDNIDTEISFDYIHIKNVMHHITGSTTGESKRLLKESLLSIKKLMNNGGYLFLHDEFDEGYFFPTLPRALIFYSLRLQNALGIKIPVEEFLPDLSVCFYTRKELIKAIKDCGFEILDIYVVMWSNTKKKKILLIRDWGTILLIAKLNH